MNWSALRRVGMTAVVVRVSVLTAGRLGDIRLDRHATRNHVSCCAAPGSVLGSTRATKTLRQLFDQCLSDIVHGNVNRIGNTKHDKRAFTRVGEHCVRSIQFGIGGLLDFSNANASFADDGADQDVGD